jgi:hypothetical protein
MASLDRLPTELQIACVRLLDQPTLSSITRVSRKFHKIAEEILYETPSVNGKGVGLLCTSLVERPELGRHIKHLEFRESPIAMLPWTQTVPIVQALQRLLGDEPPESLAVQWRSALFDSKTLGGQQAFVVCSAPNVHSVVSGVACFSPDHSLWALLKSKLCGDTAATLPLLTSLGMQAGSELHLPFPPTLTRLVVKQAEDGAAFDLTLLPRDWSLPMRTMELLQCQSGAEMLRSVVAAHVMPHLTKLVVLDFAWDSDADYGDLVELLAAQCKRLHTLELNFGYQDFMDDDAISPLTPSCWAIFSELRTLTLHRDLIYNRDDRDVLLHLPPCLPRLLETLKLTGLHEHDLLRQSLPTKQVLQTERRRLPSLQWLCFSADLDAIRDSPRPPRFDDLQPTLSSIAAAASLFEMCLAFKLRHIGDSYLQEYSLM